MKTRNIIIIIICTIILVLVLIITLQKKPDIENIYLSSDRNPDFEKLRLNNKYSFNNRNLDIYLIIEAKYLTPEDEIKVEWSKTEGNSYKIIQENILSPDRRGSGKIVISLVKKDNIYSPGNYNVKVYLNGEYKISEEFNISDKT